MLSSGIQVSSFGVYKHCHSSASSFHPLKTLLVESNSWCGSLIALFSLHSCIIYFHITVSKINFLSLFVKSHSVYLHPIQSYTHTSFVSIFLHAHNVWFDLLSLVHSKHTHSPVTHPEWHHLKKGSHVSRQHSHSLFNIPVILVHIFFFFDFSPLVSSYLNFKT